MSGLTLPAACLCLTTGVLLGGLFLGCKLLRGLLYGGRLMAAVLDVLFCLVWALTAFFCALAIDRGRLRMLQLLLQGLGAWGAIVALDPFVNGVTSLVRRLLRRIREAVSRPLRFLRGKLRARRAAALEKRILRRGARKKRRREKKIRGKAGKGKPTYRKPLKKRKIYASKQKKSKNPLEKLT